MRLQPFVLGLVAGALLYAFGSFRWTEAMETEREATCSSGLDEAPVLFADYRDRHGGKWPKALSDLDVSRGSGDALRCPKARRLGVNAYLYLPPHPSDPNDTPILLCWRHPRLMALTKGMRFRRWAP